MHKTTVYPTVVVLRHVNYNNTWKHMVHPDALRQMAFDAALQYFRAVLVSCALVRPLVPTPEHPWVMHETTVYPTVVVLRHVNFNSSCKYMVHPDALDAVLQYFLAVLVSCVLVRPLVPRPEHPWWCMRLLCTPL